MYRGRRSNNSRWLCRLVGIVPALILLTEHPASAIVAVNVARAGFPSMGRAGDVVRAGAWVPIVVDLELVNQHEFFGTVRVGQRDIDGDECYDSVDVHLREETGGAQRVTLYALANSNPAGLRGRLVVELFDGEGNAVQVFSLAGDNSGEQDAQTSEYQVRPVPPPETISDDSILILSISTGAMGRISSLVVHESDRIYPRPIHVGHISPSDLPEHWIGLETVDYIVWDDAQPEKLTDAQLRALVEWARQGGTILIAASRSASSIKLTNTIYDVLPVEIADVEEIENLPALRRKLLGPPGDDVELPDDVAWWKVPFSRSVPMVQCTRREGTESIFFSQEHATDVLSRGRLGRGQIVFCAVTLRDLFSAPGSANEFFEAILQLPVLPNEPSTYDPKPLFKTVVGAVAFNRQAGLYLMLVGFCSIGYVLAATFGSWTLLGQRGWRQHSWSAFAVVGLVGTLLSVLAVNSVRGFGGETLHQVTIVDAEAGRSYGFATAYFGLKTGIDKRLDLWLPNDPISASEPGRTNCFLRPLPVSGGGEPARSFADPVDYRMIPASALIEDVRIRGTLKRFEGRWEGPIDGSLHGEISIRGRGVGARILEGSYVSNELAVELRNCFLIHTTEDTIDWKGLRSERIYVYPLGNLPPDGNRIDLYERCYQLDANETMAQFLQHSTLAERQKSWGEKIRSLLGTSFGVASNAPVFPGEEENALLLLSTLGEYDPALDAGAGAMSFSSSTWSRDRARQLDLRGQFRRDTVILIGFADDPGPVQLFRRTGDNPFRPLRPEPERSWTMYRFRIPATLYEGRADDDEDDDDILK